jgi:Coenzyme PQQ synthesis protein D (PqqD)
MHYTTQVPMLVSRQFGDEVILANFETGVYYSLTETAADIWLGLQSGATVEEIVAAFATQPATGTEGSRASITKFVDELLVEKIILPQTASADRQPWSPQISKSFSQPVLNRYEDLRDLLFLDPVHDVTEAGWPTQAKDEA